MWVVLRSRSPCGCWPQPSGRLGCTCLHVHRMRDHEQGARHPFPASLAKDVNVRALTPCCVGPAPIRTRASRGCRSVPDGTTRGTWPVRVQGTQAGEGGRCHHSQVLLFPLILNRGVFDQCLSVKEKLFSSNATFYIPSQF